MKKWRLGWDAEIEEVEVVRETEHSVWLRNEWGEYRHPKASKTGIYYDTFEQARDHVHNNLKSTVESARNRLRLANEDLQEFEARHAIRSETSVQALPVRKHT